MAVLLQIFEIAVGAAIFGAMVNVALHDLIRRSNDKASAHKRPPTFYLWCDLETSGLQPEPYILESYFMLTDNTFTQIGNDLHHVIYNPVWREDCDDYAITMHTESGLATDLDDASHLDGTPRVLRTPLLDVENEVLALVHKYVPKDSLIMLAGSGIANYDLPIIRNHWPTLAKRLAFFTLDIGCARRLARAAGRILKTDGQTLDHRAKADVLGSIAQAREMRAILAPRRSIFHR